MSRQSTVFWAAAGWWPALSLLRLWAIARSALAQFERRNLWLIGILFLALARRTDEVKVFTLALLRSKAMAFTVLPDAAALTRNGMRAIVEVLAVHAADCAVKYPVFLLLSDVIKLLPKLLFLRLELSLGQAFTVGGLAIGILGLGALGIFFQSRKFFLVEDALDLTLLETLFASKPS